jgi:RNA polymerase sigma-B factor
MRECLQPDRSWHTPAITATVPASTLGRGRAPEERTLLRRAREGDGAARGERVARMLPLVRSLAARYRGRESFEDLVQVGCLGLVKAIDRFDLDRPVAFSSYAVPTIAGELKRHLRDHGWSVRPPRGLQERILDVEKTLTELSAEGGRPPTVAQIGERLGLTDEQVLEAMDAERQCSAVSLDAPSGFDEEGTGGTVADRVGQDDDGFLGAEARGDLDGPLAQLAPREREIVRLRFEEDLTQDEIATRVGLSQMHVSRLLRASLTSLRVELERGPADALAELFA